MVNKSVEVTTFAKAFAAAGKEAPKLAKAYSDEVKSAEGLPLQWDMIKEKIQLEGEQAIKKAPTIISNFSVIINYMTIYSFQISI